MSVAVVVNPTTLGDVAAVRALVDRRCAELGLGDPRWYETSVDDGGAGAARRALVEGARLVIACGGDGTAMAVVTVLAGTGVAMGLLPSGTGNLFARNLELPLDLGEALEATLTGRDRALDVGRVVSEPGGRARCFAVMVGLGLDAAVMADTSAGLKRRIGWVAYLLSAVRHLPDRPMSVRLRLNDRPWTTREARMVLIGNVGRVQGGIPLLPGADPADGLLDVAVVAPRNPLDWARVLARVLLRRTRSDHRLERLQATRVEVRTARPRQQELDGEPIGAFTALRVEVDPGALTVRLPR